MNEYRIIEAKDRYGYEWYIPQRLSSDNTWEDISRGWINQEAAMDRIRRDITHKVVWEGSEEDVVESIKKWEEKHD